MKIKLTLLVLLISLLFVNCDSDPCDSGYTQIKNNDGSSYCLPDYVVGEIQNFEKGNIFYHQEYGIISFNDGNWFDNQNIILNNLDQ